VSSPYGSLMCRCDCSQVQWSGVTRANTRFGQYTALHTSKPYRWCVHWKKMCHFRQSVHNDPNRIMMPRGVGQTHNEIHADVIPFA
jgi:hypothetical protein